MSQRKRILLVDDEADIALALSLGLRAHGFLVDAFTSSTEALTNFKHNFYHLGLLDLKMPEMDGFELYKSLRRQDQNIKICFITAYDVDYERVRDYSGCIIKKPITIDNLVKRIESELNTN